jgi:hypothetical protein
LHTVVTREIIQNAGIMSKGFYWWRCHRNFEYFYY